MSSTRGWLLTKALLGAAVALTLAGAVGYGTALAGSTSNVSAASRTPADASFDARLKGFLQKRFLIDDPGRIEVGPSTQSPVSGILARLVSVRNDKGQGVKAEVFTDSSERHVILGQMYDLKKDPWDRTDLKAIHLEDRPTMGPEKAPVTIVEFADFECPFCARAFGMLETMVNTTYRGKLRLIFKAYPLNGHPWAVRAAVAAECARLQNPEAFWLFAREFYTEQGSINPQNVDRYIEETARRTSLDLKTFDACVSGKTALGRVTEDAHDGVTVSVNSTPTFFINGVRVVGLPEEKTFDFVVREQINEASRTARR